MPAPQTTEHRPVDQFGVAGSVYEEEAGARSKLEPEVSRGLCNPDGSSKQKEEAEAKPRWEPEIYGLVQGYEG